jgi:hypothetical protein
MSNQQIPIQVAVKFEWKVITAGSGPMNKPTAEENLKEKLQELTDGQFQIVHVIYKESGYTVTAVKQHIGKIAQAGSSIIRG